MGQQLSLATYRASYLKTDGVRQTIFSMGFVLTRDNDHGVFGTESEHTARHRKLNVRMELGIADPIEIGLGLVHTREK